MAATPTALFDRANTGDRQALNEIIMILYSDVQQAARRQLRNERSDHTLNATALVSEAYLRLAKQEGLQIQSRGHFIGMATKTMRRLLIDYARARNTQKRGSGERPIPLDQVEGVLSDIQADEVLALKEALKRLERISERRSKLVEYRFFGGLSLEETAKELSVSVSTIRREWDVVLPWLRKEIREELG